MWWIHLSFCWYKHTPHSSLSSIFSLYTIIQFLHYTPTSSIILSVQFLQCLLSTDHTMGRHSILQYRDIHVGMVSNDSSAFPSPPTAGTSVPISPFIGEMQSLYINGKYVFEMARAGHLNRMEVSLCQWRVSLLSLYFMYFVQIRSLLCI